MKSVSLVLSGGGSRGIAHIAVIEELERQGYQIHSVAGTSMGALVGGVYAAGKLKEFKEWIVNFHQLDLFRLVDFTLIRQGLIKGDRLFEELKHFIPDINIEDLDINYSATATNLISRKEVVYTKGSLLKAIRASVSIPNIFTPLQDGNNILVDGGVVNNIPVNHALRIKGDVLIAVNVNANVPLPDLSDEDDEVQQEDRRVYKNIVKNFNIRLSKLLPSTEEEKEQDKTVGLGYFDIMNTSYEMMRDQLVKLYLVLNPPDVLIETSRSICSIFDFYKSKELLKAGRQSTIHALYKAFPDQYPSDEFLFAV